MGNNPSGFPFELGDTFASVPKKVSGISRWESPFCEDGWECYRGYHKDYSNPSSSNIKKGGNSNPDGSKKDSMDLSNSSSSSNKLGLEEDDRSLHQVTIFKTEKSNSRMKSQPKLVECNIHHFNRIKTLKHPCILKYIDGIELEKELLLVTEPVVPLLVWLEKRLKELDKYPEHCKQIYQSLEEEIAWGFRCILKALAFLHDSFQKYSHCNISPNAIYVTRSGDWRLGSFQLLCEWKEYGEFVQHYIDCSAAQSMWTDEKFFSPERRNSSYNLRELIKDTNPGIVDIFAFGELMDDIFSVLMSRFDVVNNMNSVSANNKRAGSKNKANKLSSSLAAILKRMKDPIAKNRPTCTAILNQSYFRKKPLNIILDFLENLSLKDDGEVMHFFEAQLMPIISKSYEKLLVRENTQAHKISLSNKDEDENDNALPYNICVLKIFPLLRNYLHLDPNATNDDMIQKLPPSSVKRKDMGNTPSIPNSPCLIKALPILMNLFCMSRPSDFTILMEGSICGLFAMNDRAVRCSLLYALPNIANKISIDNINTRIFDATLFGLNDSLLAMREATLKGLISLTDKLNDKNLNDKLIKSLTRLQSDPEPALRCNTTIFLGKIASQIKEDVRNRMLLPSIIKGLRDDFPHSRLASLKAMIACLTYINETTICTQVLPILSLCLIDPDSMVRDQAFIALNSLTQKLSLYSEVLRQEEVKRNEEAALLAQQQKQEQYQGRISQQQGISNSNSSSSQSPVKQVVSSTAKSATSTANSLANWAVQKLVNIDPSETPTSSGNSTIRPSQQPPPPPGPPPVQSRSSMNNINANGNQHNSSTLIRNSGRPVENEKQRTNTSGSRGMKLGSRKDEGQVNLDIKKLSLSDDGWGDDDFFGDESSVALSDATVVNKSTGRTVSDSGAQNSVKSTSHLSTSMSQPKFSGKETKLKDGWDEFNDDDLDVTFNETISQGNHKLEEGINSTISKETSFQREEKRNTLTNTITTKSSIDLGSTKVSSNKVTKTLKPQKVKAQKLKVEDDDWDDF